MKEEWRPVVGFEKYYQVSNFGKIRNLPRKVSRDDSLGRKYTSVRGQRIMKTCYNRCGYEMVTLCVNRNKTPHGVHKLVAEAFIPNPNNKPQVNHIDGDKTNNRVDNLEWCTCSENNIHKFRVLAYKNMGGETTRKGVVCIETGKKYYSLSECERMIGISRYRISRGATTGATIEGCHFSLTR